MKTMKTVAEQRLERIIAAAPPLTDEQISNLAILMRRAISATELSAVAPMTQSRSTAQGSERAA